MTEHDSPCRALVELHGRVGAENEWRETHEAQHFEEREATRKTNERIFLRLDEALKRPPIWVTAILGLLTTIIGILMGVVGMFLSHVR